MLIRKAQLEFALFGFPVAAWLFLTHPPLFSITGTFIIIVVVVVVIVVFIIITIVAVTIVTLLAFSSFYNS